MKNSRLSLTALQFLECAGWVLPVLDVACLSLGELL